MWFSAWRKKKIQLYLTTLATHNKSWFPGGAETFNDVVDLTLFFIEWQFADIDAISFSSDRDIVLHSACLFGREEPSYSVTLGLIQSYTKSIRVSKTGEFSSKLLQGKVYSHTGYRVSFDKKVISKKNRNYHIRAKISGPPSLCGVSGARSVQCPGVTFAFMNSEYSNNETE